MTKEEAIQIVQEKAASLHNAAWSIISVDGVLVATITFIPTRTEKALSEEEWEKWWSLSEKLFSKHVGKPPGC
jgi:hypothetical protein